MLLLEVLLSVIFRQILFSVPLAPFSPSFIRILLTVVEYLVDFEALHELADLGKVVESEVTFAIPVKNLEAIINLISLQVGADSLRRLPELVLVHMTYLIF